MTLVGLVPSFHVFWEGKEGPQVAGVIARVSEVVGRERVWDVCVHYSFQGCLAKCRECLGGIGDVEDAVVEVLLSFKSAGEIGVE